MKKPASQLNRIGLVANPDKPACVPALRTAVRLIRRAGAEVLTDLATQRLTGLELRCLAGARRVASKADLVIVFGGDGTILRLARETAGLHTPLLGINVGSLGFLTAASARQLPAVLRAVLAGRYSVDRRTLIEAQRGSGAGTVRQLALNDYVIGRTSVTRLIELEVSVDGEMLTRYRCDGLIVSSPTGSTAYSLAAGGALVAPDAEVFAVTPICPHTLSNRPVIVNLHSVIRVKVLTPDVDIHLAADGQVQSRLAAGDVITIRRSRQRVSLVRLLSSSFFDTLRHKLRWSGSSV